MAVDPRLLETTQLVQLLNSTPLGDVCQERIVHRHRARAGLRIGDGRTIDLPRYAGMLRAEYRAQLQASASPGRGEPYDAHRERAAARNRAMSESGRNIGDLPPVTNPERRARAERDLRIFCETYLVASFWISWSDDQLKVIAKIERSVLDGGLFAMAMPRGSGKTTLCEAGCLWALLNGHRSFVALIGANEEQARGMLDSIKTELETNERILEDYPEVVYPIHCLEGIHQRAAGQLYRGKKTHIGWTANEIVLPTMQPVGWTKKPIERTFLRARGYSRASGAIVRVAGITGQVRGMKHKRIDGTSIRPSLVLVDDPQTDESARSPSQCATRERILTGAILGLAGPGQKISGLMTLTVVRPDDMADRILDRQKHPEWQAERTKMIYAWPKNQGLWDKYAELWRRGQLAEDGIRKATEFYRKHQSQMDEGAQVAWPARYYPEELSAIQHAWNLRLSRGDAAFFAEYQNDPLPEEDVDDDLISVDAILGRLNGHARRVVPLGCSHLTAFIDVQQKALFWLVAAWEDDFTGHVVDYGTEPDQKATYFTLRDVRRTLAMAAPRAGLEGAIYAGLERLTEALLGREWRRDDGAMVRIDRCLIDANWGQSTSVIYKFCRQSKFAAVLLPSHGSYVGAASTPFSEYKRKRGDRVGLNWRITPSMRGIRRVVFDSNYWKSFIHTRLAVPMGDPGSLALFGRKPEVHRMIAEHLTSEYRIRTEGRGRKVDEWKLRDPHLDNHWLDGLVGSAVAASIQGAGVFGGESGRQRRPRIRLSDLQRGKR